MYLTAIGAAKGSTVFISVVKDPAKALDAKTREHHEELTIVESHKLAPGWDSLALLMVQRELSSFRRANDWFTVPPAQAKAAITRALRATQIGKPKKYRFGEVVKRIRTMSFGTNQQVIAEIAGCDASTVSRWEANSIEPTLADIKRLRDFAFAHSLPWDDALIWNERDNDAGTPYLETETRSAAQG